jgi:cytochrome c oxidase cbb3-type subunit 3
MDTLPSSPRLSTPMALIWISLLIISCEREKRDVHSASKSDEQVQIAQSSVAPGQDKPQTHVNEQGERYEKNAYHLSQGKKYYAWFNCTGCHANGGGDIGPALMDDKWIYGGSIDNIVQSIREGRPNGMPSFRGKIPDDQIWEIAAFVRSMQRSVPQDAAPQREDDLTSHPGENRLPQTTPSPAGAEPAGAAGQ